MRNLKHEHEIELELESDDGEQTVDVTVFFDLEADEEMFWSYARDTIGYRVTGYLPVINSTECKVNREPYLPTPQDEKSWEKAIYQAACEYVNNLSSERHA